MRGRASDSPAEEFSETHTGEVQSGPLLVREAARALGLSVRTIRRAIQRGELLADRTGRGFLITAEALDRYRGQRRPPKRRGLQPRLALVPKPVDPPALVPFPATNRRRLSTLPAPLTRIVGRENEATTIAALLRRSDIRLVTLTGPGGVGKTRLSLHVASNLAPEIADGAVFVPLAPVRSPDLVAATIAIALEVRDGEDTPPLERVLHALRNREALLVLDNFEHLVEAGPLIVDLLVACPGLTILVTSRAPLRLSGERVFAVPPLALPERPGGGRGSRRAPLPELALVEAVRLLVERAEAVAAGFALTPENATAVAAICERTDGLPLAIELAAARTALMSPDALLARLDPRLPLLSGGPRDQPDRLRTMHDAIAWSHDLLSPEERTCFQRLSVFVGGCTIDGAEAVGGVPLRSGGGGGYAASGGEGGEGVRQVPDPSSYSLPALHSLSAAAPPERSATPSVLDLVQGLVDQAVLRRSMDGADQPRFGMLETIREYGLEQLAASGEEEATLNAHAAWYVTLAELAQPELAGPDQGIWVRRLEADMANIRAALDWLVARSNAELALRISGAIGWRWSTTPHLEEARARFDDILALPGVEEEPLDLAKVLASSGDVADWQGDQTRARAHYERALAIYREIDDRWRMVGMLRGLGSSAIDRGELDLALALLDESLALAHEVGHDWEAAAAINLIGTAVSARGDLGPALERHEEAAAAWRQLGDTGHVITALGSAAWVALLSSEWSRAVAAYREALTLATEGGDEWYITWCVIGAGGLVARRNARLAAELLAAGHESRERLGVPLRPHVAAAIDDMIAAVRSRLGKAEFAATWETGRALPINVAATQAFGVFDAEKPDAPMPFGLTRRERDVLRLLTDGRTDKEIASTLFVARATASHHVAAILAKLGVDSRTAAAAVALRHELL